MQNTCQLVADLRIGTPLPLDFSFVAFRTTSDALTLLLLLLLCQVGCHTTIVVDS